MSSQPLSLEATPKPPRIRPFVALRAFWKVIRNPDDTESGARLVLSLDGDRGEQNFRRFARHPNGARILAEGCRIETYLNDWDRLRALPPESLGRAYLDFMEAEGFTTDGLERAVAPVVAEIEADTGGRDAARLLFGDRIRALHDVWHVVTGYSRDLFGEMLLLAFSYEQLHTRAYAWMVPLAGFVNEFRVPGTKRLIEGARARGRDSEWLPTVDWVPLLERPLHEVRVALGVGEPPPYARYYRDPNGFGLIPEAEWRGSRAAGARAPEAQNGTWPP